jgi:chemotaxis family two-component system response regulator Rcp1
LSMSSPNRPIEILLVEDNPGDVVLIQEMLGDTETRHNLKVAYNGDEAIRQLYADGHARKPTPDIILLDLKLPQMSGHQVLATVKGDPELWRIPVIVLTSSSSDEDIAKAYDYHANCYITKPVGLENYYRVMRSIEEFWFKVVTLPTEVNQNK